MENCQITSISVAGSQKGSTLESVYFCNGDPVNNFDPDGRCFEGLQSGLNGTISPNAPTSGAFYAGNLIGGAFSGAGSGLQNAAGGEVNGLSFGTVKGAFGSDPTSSDYMTGQIGGGVAAGALTVATGGAAYEAAGGAAGIYTSLTAAANSPLVLALGGATAGGGAAVVAQEEQQLVNSGGLVHMTEAADEILSSGKLGLPSNLYAGPAANANLSGWALTARTGLNPGGSYAPVPIPAAAQSAFSQVTPIGIFTAIQRLGGQQYAPQGVIDLATGAFTRTGVNWNQVGIYVGDASLTGVLGAGGVYLYNQSHK